MYQVKVTDGETMIFRERDSAWIPCDPSNTDYQEYLKWKEKHDKDNGSNL